MLAPGIAALSNSGGGALEAVACPANRACTAGGFYYNPATKQQQGFVIDAADGLWEPAQHVPLVPQLNTGGSADVTAVACLAAGECGAGGFYRDASGLEGFLGSEVSSTWDGSVELPGSGGGAAIDTEACTSLGTCAAGGFYTDAKGGHQAFVVSEADGDWGPMQELAGGVNKGENAQVSHVSCAVSSTLESIVGCAAVGYYAPSANHGQAFTATLANGKWGLAAQLPGAAALDKGGFAQLNSVSCRTAGNCTAGGSYTPAGGAIEPMVATEKNGTWGTAIELPGAATLNTGKNMSVWQVSCSGAGFCSAAGDFRAGNHSQGVWVASQKSGRWGQAGTIPGLSALATGGQAEVTGLSCATQGWCGLVGDYYTTDSQQPFVVSGSVDAPTDTTMTLSAASVVYGREQAERISVTTFDVFGSNPTGTVTIKAGNTVVCAITLKSRVGSCTVPATKFGPGTVGVTASYGGGIYFHASSTGPLKFTVKKATTKTALGLSRSSVTYGQEQAERLSVAVSPQYGGTPAGPVAVKAGNRTLCTITLRAGKGSCTLTSHELKAGTYTVTASYAGRGGYTGSASARRTLKITG